MSAETSGLFMAYDDICLLDGVRTPFVDYNGALGLVSPIDLGIKVARALFERTKIAPSDVGSVIAGSVAQTSFDAYVLPRNIGLYSGVHIERPALLVQRVCGTGIEAISQAADAVTLKKNRTRSLRRRGIHEPQSRCCFYAPQRLSYGPGGVQGFLVGSAVGSCPGRNDGGNRGNSCGDV